MAFICCECCPTCFSDCTHWLFRRCCCCCGDNLEKHPESELVGAMNQPIVKPGVAATQATAVGLTAGQFIGGGSNNSNSRTRSDSRAFPQPMQTSLGDGEPVSPSGSINLLDDDDVTTPRLKKKRSVTFANHQNYDTSKLIHHSSPGPPRSVYKRRSSFVGTTPTDFDGVDGGSPPSASPPPTRGAVRPDDLL